MALIYIPGYSLKSITAKDPGQNPVVTRNYLYSALSNITSKNTEHGEYTYEYDDLSRITAAINPTLDDETYTYDPMGNRLTSAKTTGTWTYNANNELQGFDDTSFQYDQNGNTTRKTKGTVETNYIYDVEDRLIQVKDGSNNEIAKYYYDPFGRRLWKDVGGVRTYYGYSGEGLIGEYDSTGTVIKSYGYVPDSTWSTDPLFKKIGNEYYWYQNDHSGTPQKLIATNGLIVWSATYDSFGNCTVDIAGIENNFRFPGQYYDEETGLYYNHNRYYDPETGRYMRTDPLGDGLNLYAYCFSNPVNLMDPQGLCGIKIVWNRILSPGLRILGGVAEIAVGFTFGTVTLPSVVGGIAGAIVMAHGADQIWAGLREAYYGHYVDSYTSQALQGIMSPTAARTTDAMISVVGTAGLGYLNFRGLAAAGVAAEVVASNSTKAIVPMAESTYMVGAERSVAGYQVWGNASKVGTTYNVNILGLYATKESQGLGALIGSLRAEGAAIGATRISISGNAIINKGILNISEKAAARYGLQIQRINNETIILTGGI